MRHLIGSIGFAIACTLSVQAAAADVRSAIDVCLASRASLDDFVERATNAGLQRLAEDAELRAYAQIGDSVFMYRAADELPDPEDAKAMQAEISNAIGAYWFTGTPTNLRAIFALADGGLLFVRSSPTYGVSGCRVYAVSDIPNDVLSALGPRTILTKSREPYIVTLERPLDTRNQNGFVEAIHTPSLDFFTDTLGTPLSFRHLVEINTPSRQ